MLAAVHECAPSGAARSVDPQRLRSAPDGLEDLIAELGPDRLVALWRAYAEICRRDSKQRAWWGPLMFSPRQAAIVARMAAPEIERLERERRAAAERAERERRAAIEAERLEREHPIRSQAERDADADDYFASFMPARGAG